MGIGGEGSEGERESEERRTQQGVGVTGHSGEGKGSERTLGEGIGRREGHPGKETTKVGSRYEGE